MRERGVRIVDVRKEPEDAYAEHCRDVDLATAPLRDCISYYNGEGNAAPGSLAFTAAANGTSTASRLSRR